MELFQILGNFVAVPIISIIAGLLSSYLFLIYYLKRKVPKIEISGHICKQKINAEGQYSYLFKFVNKTDTEIYDVRIEPTFFKPIGNKTGKNMRSTDIVLKDSFISHIPKKTTGDEYNLHARQLRTIQNIEEEWTDASTYIRLTIIAKHSLSGFSRFYTKEFLSKDCIVEKQFVPGDSLEVH